MSVEKFDQWCVVEVMGHKKFAGRVTEGPFGLVQIDVPEVTLSSGQLLPPFSKMLGAHAIYAMTPCTEETARAFARDFRSQAFHSYELPALTAPKIFEPTPERDPEWDADNDDVDVSWSPVYEGVDELAAALAELPVTQEALDAFIDAVGVDVPARDPQLEEVDDNEPF